jgi:hypothetical protein
LIDHKLRVSMDKEAACPPWGTATCMAWRNTSCLVTLLVAQNGARGRTYACCRR